MACDLETNEIAITRGDTETIAVTFRDENSALINITGYTVFFTVKRKQDISKDDSVAVIQKDVTSHTDPVNGATEIVLSSSDTAIGEGSYIYDIQTNDGSGNITTVIKGKFTVSNDVTKRIA